jgi:uncharacterized protein (TIGR02453 family)
MLEPQTLKFLTQLKKNNNKPWFDAHRAQYEAARIDFSNFLQLVIDALQKSDTTLTGITSRECLFRINRDIRFSKDKKEADVNRALPVIIFIVNPATVLLAVGFGCQMPFS